MYPSGELRAAVWAAVKDGHRLVDVDPDAGYQMAVRYLERFGYLPRDQLRVERATRRLTEQAAAGIARREAAAGVARRAGARERSQRRRLFVA